MKKFKILLSGNVNYIADTENQAIEYAEQDLKHIHSKYNVGIFAISEVKEDGGSWLGNSIAWFSVSAI